MVSASAAIGAMLNFPWRWAWENRAAAAAHSASSSPSSAHTSVSRTGIRWCRKLLAYTASSSVCRPGVYNALSGTMFRMRSCNTSTVTAAITALRRAASERETADAARYREMVDYYTAWVHQIKTPIAAMRLTLQPDDTPNARRLMSQLLRIEQYVDMVLMYLRLDEGTSDYVIRACDLDGIIRQSLRKFAGEFIDRKLTLHYEPLHLSVVTDEKWLGFVVEQVLSNALKYTPDGGSITIDAEAPATLCIRDTGIGITAEDLPRIFDRGYTGRNGRTYRQASGIGLYLCRRICRDLGHTITASSAAGEGTVLRLDLSRRTGPLE